MLGVSRAAQAQVRAALQGALDSGADWAALSDELFGVVDALDSSHMLRRALGDPSRWPADKRALARRLLEGKVQPATLAIVDEAVSQRWAQERDVPTALEQAAVETQVAIADATGRADDVEEQLFRFERLVSATPELREAVNDRQLPAERKAELVRSLLADKAQPETVRLAVRAATHPRGLRYTEAIEGYLGVAEQRRQQLSAVVTVAEPLTAQQHDRLAAALGRIYSRPVVLKVLVDEHVMGGIRVQVGDEVIDGTVMRRLDEARRLMGS